MEGFVRRVNMRVLYIGMEFDYGNPAQGTSFEHDNFYPALKEWSGTTAFQHFDAVRLATEHGNQKMSQMLLADVDRFKPDVVFSVFFAFDRDPTPDAIRQISKTGCKTVNWFCDSDIRYDNFDKPWSDHLDYCVTTSARGLEKYRKDGLASKVIKSQWAVSPKYKKLDLPRDVNISFIGQPHSNRREIIHQLSQRGFPVETYGSGWTKRLTFDEMVQMFNRSKINLNLNNAAMGRSEQIKGRNFEVPGCGGFLLTGACDNLFEYYEFGKEIAVFNSFGQMCQMARHYLDHEEEREKIALAGYQRTIRDHTYSRRLDSIFSAMGFSKAQS